jgi:osmotically-inducible protein OsmY
MQYRKPDNTLALLGGAALGAAAMYLLDPEAGRRRRENLREATSETFRSAGEALTPAMESLGERARDVAGRVTHGASALGAGLTERASEAGAATSSMAGSAYGGTRDWLGGIGESIGEMTHRFGRRAGRTRDGATERAQELAERARRMLPWHEEEKSHAGAYTAAGLTAAALGAAAIYLFDPTQGRRRRQDAAGQANRIVSQCGRAFRQTGRQFQDMMNRGRGMAHEARSRYMPRGGEDVSPEMMIQRIRSQMGHHVADAGSIAVMVDRNGTVTLSGPVQHNELDALLAMVNRTPGVTELINQLDVQGSPMSGTGMGQTAPRL